MLAVMLCVVRFVACFVMLLEYVRKITTNITYRPFRTMVLFRRTYWGHMSEKKQIVVVGAGVLGASVAVHLAEAGAAVTLVEAGEPGMATSAVSFAWLNAFSKRPFHYHDLNRRSMQMWDGLARRLGGDVGLTWGGNLLWAVTEAGAKALQARVAQLHAWDYPARLLTLDEARAMEPKLVIEQATAVCHAPNEGHVDTARFIRACLETAVTHGATVHTHTQVVGFEKGVRGELTAVVTSKGTLPCDTVVLAVGADTPAIARLTGVEIAVYHTFGATFYTEPLSPVFQTVSSVHTAADSEMQVAFRQLPDGTLVFYGGSHGTAADRSLGRDEAEVAQVFAQAKTFLPLLHNATIQEIRRGRRPIPQDGLPIIGFADTVPNLYLTTMHSGVTLAALTGEFAAIEIMHETEIELLAPYRPGRFIS